MQQSTNQHPSMTASGVGYRLDRQPALQLLILFQVGLELSAEVEHQNHSMSSTTVSSVNGDEMLEIKSAATSITNLINSLKAQVEAAQTEFNAEGFRAVGNVEKMKSVTAELRDANTMMEQALGSTGSNFQPSGSGSSGVVTDSNGVTLNPGATK